MTTMHLDEVRDMPDRMYNMLGNSSVNERFINSVYKYIDLVVLVWNVTSTRKGGLSR